MTNRQANPGVNRQQRITDEGLARLEKQLSSGRKISRVVLDQWVLRYGEQAEALIKQYCK